MLPRFDIQFYQVPKSAIDALGLGPCGIFINCEDFARATKPVPAKYVHPEHVSVEATVGQMGNHLIDVKTPEMGDPPGTFSHIWIFGAYDGRVIFHETMATLAFLTSGQNFCADIKQPGAWAQASYYPTRYCFRNEAPGGQLKVFMEGFVLRPAG